MHGDDAPLATFQREVADDIAGIKKQLESHIKATKAQAAALKHRMKQLDGRLTVISEILESQQRH